LSERRAFPILGPVSWGTWGVKGIGGHKVVNWKRKVAVDKLLILDGKSLSFKVLDVRRNPKCPVCGGSKKRDIV